MRHVLFRSRSAATFVSHLTNCTVYAFNIGFYALPAAAKLGFAGGFGLFGALSAFALAMPAILVVFGEKIRKAQGVPKEHSDL